MFNEVLLLKQVCFWDACLTMVLERKYMEGVTWYVSKKIKVLIETI